MSYHDRKGRFTSYNRANVVNKGGERFKMVRTLEPIKPPEKDPEPAPEPKNDQAEAVLHAKAKVQAQGEFIGKSVIAIDEMCPAHGLKSKKKGKKKAKG